MQNSYNNTHNDYIHETNVSQPGSAEATPDVSVIIINYKTPQLVCDCLDSIRKHTCGVSYEVIVVDNDSADDSEKIITSAHPWARFVQSGGNLGFGKANNLGMQLARGRYFFLLNSDTIVLNNALKIFYDYSKSHPDIAMTGCILKGTDGQPCHSYGRFMTPTTELRDAAARWLRFLKDDSLIHPQNVKSPMEVDYITGADIWMPRSTWEKTGGFDPDYFMYYEESDWQLRMARIGMKRIIIPGPEIIHLEGGSDKSASSIWSPSRLSNFKRSKRLFARKHFHKKIYPFYRIGFVLSEALAMTMLAIVKHDKRYLKLITK